VRRALCLACLLALVGAPPAAAHGLAGTAESFADFLWLGYTHMLVGWDHLLFAGGVALLAGSAGRAAKLVSLFALGHSATLLLATLAGLRLSAELVDVVIALSLVYIGLRLLQGRPTSWGWTRAAITGFGLVHGLGLSTRLQEQPLPEGFPLVGRVLSFNLGVELGQLTVLALLAALAVLVRRTSRAAQPALRPLGAALAAVGVVSAGLLGFLALRPGGVEAAPDSPRHCVERREPYDLDAGSARLGGHTRRFYPPGQHPEESDVEHQVGDGYMVVRYSETLPAADVRRLSQWAASASAVIVVPDPAPGAPPLAAATLLRAFRCSQPDVAALAGFRDRWLAYLRGGS
jgi:hydrogenase/urease accessory protein HupE